MNFSTWKNDIVELIEDLADFELVLDRPFSDNEKYPSFVVADVRDRFVEDSEGNEIHRVERTTEIFILVEIADRDQTTAEDSAWVLAQEVKDELDAYFNKQIKWITRQAQNFAIGSREVAAIKMEFVKEFQEERNV